MQMKMDIGFIGLGKMGAPMTKNLVRAGYKVNIYDKNPSPLNSLLELGSCKQNSIKDVGKALDCIFIMVYPSDRTFEVIFDEGEGLLAGIKCKEENKEGEPIYYNYRWRKC